MNRKPDPITSRCRPTSVAPVDCAADVAGGGSSRFGLLVAASLLSLGVAAPASAGEWNFVSSAGVCGNALDVDFVNEDVGFVTSSCGNDIYRTTDGGTTWASSGTACPDAYHVEAYDASTVAYAGAGGCAALSTDGGVTFTDIRPPGHNNHNHGGIHFFDADTLVLRPHNSAGQSFLTTDGGASWGNSPLPRSQSWAKSVGIDSNTAYWSDTALHWSTTDQGQSWTSSPYDPSFTGLIMATDFVDANTGWAVGSDGAIYKTTDAGSTWTPQVSGYSGWLLGVAFADANHGWAVGSGGIIATADGGATWTAEAFNGAPGSNYFRAISLTDGMVFAVTQSGSEVWSLPIAAPPADPPVFTDCADSQGSFDTRTAVLGDVDGDGDLDSVTADEFDNVHLYLNNGNGAFGAPIALSNPGERYRSAALGDLDGDGDLDVFVTVDFGTDRVLFNDGTGAFTEASVPGGYRSLFATLADLDSDGDLDAFYVGFDQAHRMLENDGSGNFVASSQALPYGCTDAEAGDVDGDGDLDLVLACAAPGVKTRLSLNDGTGFFADGGNVTPGNTVDVELADLDGDGDLDLVSSAPAADGVSDYSGTGVYLNDGTGVLASNGQTLGYSTGNQRRYGYNLGDLDGDGDLDLVASMHQGDKRSEVFLNDGDANFDLELTLSSNFTIDIALGDVDGDGDLDLWEATWSNAGDRVYIDGVTCPVAGPTDTDGDGVADDEDAFPNDPNEWDDTDGDGVGDNSDTCPGGDDGLDTDSDGVCDLLDACAGDDSSGDTGGDLVCNDTDAFPDDASETTDTDGDGVGDNGDLFPNDPNETGDEDGDGVGDNSDLCSGFPNVDTDSDGVCDSSDVCPTDPTDADDDNDQVCDVVDICVGLTNVDSDGDQVCDDLDICLGPDASGDTDYDGLCDANDNCPEDDNPGQEDADGDTIGDVCEADSDLDGVIDDNDNCADAPNADQSDIDLDGQGDACDADDDNDGVADTADNCPFYANTDQADFDGDGFGDLCDGDDDADGVADDIDSCPGTPLGRAFDDNGCSGPQRIELVCGVPSDYGWRRGRYIRCVVKEARSAWRSGLISRSERSRIIRRAKWRVWWSYFSRLRRWC